MNPGFTTLLEHGPLAASLKDAEDHFRYVYVSPEWARTLGRDPVECLGKNDYELAPAPVADALHRIDEMALHAGGRAGSLVGLGGNNGQHVLYSVAWPVEPEPGRRYVACCLLEVGPQTMPEPDAVALLERERAARLDAERALALFERKHAHVMRLIDSGILGIIVGENDTIVEANRAFLDMLGYSQEDVEARRLHFSGVSAPEFSEADRQTHEELASRGVSAPREKEYVRKDGTRVPVYAAAALLETEPKCWIGFVIDRTEQKRLEDRLRRSRVWESLGFLASGLAHDFNNLLVVILGNTALAANDPDLSPETASRLRDVMAAAQKGSQLVEQLLNYSGRGRFVHAPLDLSELVRASATTLRTPANVALRLDLRAGLPRTEGDRQLLRSLVDNLLSNAVEALGGEGGEIRVSTGVEEVERERQLVSGQELARGRYVCLLVEDSGPGIPPDLQDRIFEPFFTTRFLGRGLGLAAALGIARRHGGAITVESRPGGGTTFEVYLPVEI
jgi:PAS domain S-box-containing protein